MIITHKLAWDKCLSHQIFPLIEKGWKDEDRPIHFFWGLAGKNRGEIAKCVEKQEEWYYIDIGYITDEITRYPAPKITKPDTTYLRIVKGGLHTIKGKVGDGKRLKRLQTEGLDAEFKGWYTGDTKHVLICPSSPTVTQQLNNMTQEDWVFEVKMELEKHTDRELIVRNKPRPGNEWWGTNIRDQLKDCHCLVTNMSIASVDAILNRVPVITDGRNVSWAVASREPRFVEKPFKPGKKTVNEWLKFITEQQFTMDEIENGTGYKILKEQGVVSD